MNFDWSTCSPKTKDFVYRLQKGIVEIIGDDFIGFYVHGSLAMGGFNPNRSDIDILVVTNKSMKIKDKRRLAQFFLTYSNSPSPIEISFLNTHQLMDWHHPSPFDFHYSEMWRERYEKDLVRNTYKFLNEDIKRDTDLAAHITITNHRGICVDGEPINKVFPVIPKPDYISSIAGDFQECLKNIERDPIYCSLNLIRVFWYLKEGVISSKQEAGNWGRRVFPPELRVTIGKVLDCYGDKKNICSFEKYELVLLRNYVSKKVQELKK